MNFVQFWQQRPRLCLAMAQPRPNHAGYASRDHAHPFFELGMVLAGSCTWVLGRQRIELQQGEFILLPPRRAHREIVNHGTRARLAWIGFDFNPASPVAAPAWSSRAVPAGAWTEALTQLLLTAFEENQSGELGSHERADLALREILILASRAAEIPRRAPRQRAPDHSTRIAGSAARYLTDNLAQPLSVQAVARYHSLSAAHFSVIFKRHHGKNPKAFLHAARIARAQALLAEGRLRIKEIAATCGYADAAHFCRRFKAATGRTPKAFRAAAPA